MANLDWHGERASLDDIRLLDRSPTTGEIDEVAVRTYRLGRVRSEMARRDIAAVILNDAVNIRYATGTRNMQIFTSRNAAARYLLLTGSEAILFEFTGCMHLADGFETITEVLPSMTASYVAAGPAIAEREIEWAGGMADLLRAKVGTGARVGMERFNSGAAIALSLEGFTLCDAQEPVERARAIKSAEELKCVQASIRATERAVHNLRGAIRPGITENELWSVLHQGVIAQGGDYVETRLLNSGDRTNPWFQESSDTTIRPNSLIALDTDVVGCYGYYCDFSRTFHAGPDAPSATQKELYKTAYEQVQHNIGIIKPGMTLREYAEKAWDIPEKYFANRYYLSAHGTGMTGEYPYLYHRADFPDAGYDGVIEPNMTICVESFIGENGQGEGVKLEEHCLITDNGIEVLSQFPFEESLLA
ncbi:MAG: Xaa-Pro peptidase family protein [Pseudomonadota bacterium]